MKKLVFISVLILFSVFIQNCREPEKEKGAHGKTVIAYVYPGFRPIQKGEVDATLLTHINYAFANIVNGRMVEGYPTDSANLVLLGKLRTEFPELKLLISVGGWSWSGAFSDMAHTKETRKVFIDSAIDFLQKYQLDGLDLDWEYPGLPGNGNIHRPEDKENFTALLKECRQALDSVQNNKKLLLTIASGGFPAYLQHTEMSKISQYLDLINIMTYDYTGEWDTKTGHHSNLYSVTGQVNQNSVSKSVDLHLQAGAQRQQLVIGAAFYGRGWKQVKPHNNGLYQEGVGLSGANLSYKNILKTYLPNPAFVDFWDEAAGAPYLWNSQEQIFITYENIPSVREKVKYLKNKELAGIMFWQYFEDNNQELLKAIDDELRK